MGDRYSDNPRFLFEYLNDHINEYDIKKIIWVTRKKEIYKLLHEAGYEVYIMHSLKSIYYHFRAGVHIICNISFPVKNYNGDIMGQFSGSAIKINTFHGAAIKAGRSTGIVNTTRGILGKLRYFVRNNRLFLSIFTPGHWDKAIILSTSKECTRRVSAFCGVDSKWFVESGYPRDCKEKKLLPDEEKIVNRIRSFKKIVLYVPTFRDNAEVPHPLSEQRLIEFLSRNGYLWIEKPHPAAKNTIKVDKDNKNVIYLDSKLDINVIIPEISILVSDYSTVVYDAYSYGKPVVFYAPDYLHYLNNERGFLCDYKALVSGFESNTVEELLKLLDLAFRDESFHKKLIEKSQYEKNYVLADNKDDCKEIVECIERKLNIFSKKG